MNRNRQNHLTEKELILLANGEIDATDKARVDEHLTSCWKCRHEQTAIHRTIEDFMAGRTRELPRELPPIAPRRAELAALLAQADTESPVPMWRRVVSAVTIRRTPGIPAWVAATSSLLCLVVLYFYVVLPPAVSAEELVARAVVAQSSIATKHREVTIRVNGVAYPRRASEHGPQTAIPAELSNLIRVARLDWNDPLSAARFSAWRSALSAKRDDVQRAQDRLTLTTTDIGSGPVRKAELTVLAANFLPVAEQWEFQSGDVIQIAELTPSAEVLPESKLPDSNVSLTPASPTVNALSTTLPVATSAEPLVANPSVQTLAESELAVRAALHNIGADLGEDIRVNRTERHVMVEARVETGERKDQLVKLLEQLPNVRVEVKTFAEQAELGTAPPETTITMLQVAPRPILAKDLARVFPDNAARSEFVNRSLAAAGDAAAEAWALRSLAQRYTEPEISLLRAESLQTLGLLLRTNLDRLDASASSLRSQLTPILNSSVVQKSQGLTSTEDWRDTATLLSASVSAMQKLVVQSLSGAGDDAPPADLAPQKLTAQLADVSQLLETLRNQLQTYITRLPGGRKE